MTFDPEQRNFRIVGGGNGVLYALGADGTLTRFRHTGSTTGAVSWAGPHQIGTDWHNVVELLAGHDGSFYAIYADGTVRRSQWVATSDTSGYWASVGVQVRSGWNFARSFGGPDGVLYGVDAAGNLWRSQYAGGSLSTPVQIGSGWQGACPLIADAGGVIYGVRTGDLYWWRYAGGWVNGGRGDRVGTQWGDSINRALVAGGQGVFYVVDLSRSTPYAGSDDSLRWYRLTNWLTAGTDSGGAQWAGNLGAQVGEGWNTERWANLQGYADPFSVAPGGTVGICASTTFASLSVSVLRHAPGSAPVQVMAPQTVAGRLQRLPEGYRSRGCDWDSVLDIAVPTSWPSGVYSARLVGANGVYRDVPFAVRPSAPAATLAVILPTYTYNAYNQWAGHDAYTPGQGGVSRTLSMRRPSYTTTVQSEGRLDFELYSDLLLLRWLTSQGYGYDVYCDQDLHANPGLLAGYRAVCLGTHPEYTSTVMQQALKSYVDNGGRLIYPGGNGLYERVTVSPDGTAVTYRRRDGSRDLWREAGLPEWQILGVAFDWAGWGTFAPYKVVANHALLAGTGLSVGSTFGSNGFNFGASGQEIDLKPAGAPGVVIAVGQNSPTGAHMTVVERANGGFVFAAGSLSFVGALGRDAALDRLMRNVMDRAVA